MPGPACAHAAARPELGAARADGAQALVETCPGPRLDLAVARLRLAARRLEVLEPGVGLLDLSSSSASRLSAI